ncbi:hypothetical protein NH341_03615 [Tenacibaculum sp. XPcli2-G]|uniref:hypothetical protein n=1 Tax=Tenacibaculum sp. XPcli2-G TaxID=2954503 RepID=UPI002096EF46|nr:hypothetical protein [Tenacibaculum sp. XPcli2-G]MCO7184501.1 hypothetical protein [Tenacibaculum sp. XPcli2-G]
MNLDKKDLSYLRNNISFLKENNTITIEKGVSADVLNKLNEILNDISSIKLILFCDPNKTNRDNLFRNLDVLQFLNNLKHISIIVGSSTPLESIDKIDYIKDLQSFSLGGFYNKKINLNVLKKHNNLKELSFEHSINKKDYSIIKDSLVKIKLKDINLEYVSKNTNLKELVILDNVQNEHLLTQKYPSLKTIKLSFCKKIADFSFLNKLLDLENISFNRVNTITEVPSLKSKIIKRLEFLNCKNLQNIHNIVSYKKLEKLAITDANIEFGEIKKIAKNMLLDTFYFRSKDNSETNEFESLALKYQFQNSHAGFWK